MFARDSKDTHANAREPDVALVETFVEVLIEGRPMQKREHAVEVVKVGIDERVCEIRVRPMYLQVRKGFGGSDLQPLVLELPLYRASDT